MSKVLIVLGMHRSGTSLLAKGLHDSGITLGESLMPSSHGNKKGHYEDMEIYSFHESILKDNKLDYTVTDKDNLVFTKEHKQKMLVLIENRANEKQWGWKDPRTCLFIDEWNDALHKTNHQPYYIITYRPVEQVVDSLIRRDIVDIKTYNNIIPRWRKLRKYNRVLRETQQLYLQTWKYHMTKIMNFHRLHKSRSMIILSSEISHVYNPMMAHISDVWDFDITPVDLSDFYSAELYNTLSPIEKYSDKQIQEIQNYFYENRLRPT